MKTSDGTVPAFLWILLLAIAVGVVGVNLSKETLAVTISGLMAWSVTFMCLASWLVCWCCRIDIFYRLLAAFAACALGGLAGHLIMNTYRLWSAL